ncbi:Aspartyl/glutamyl-tRNA(Asn/Gln) amidotransferase subunit A [Candidatus Portiera aleyrodidarum]|uniref:Asp-tRNA(Asn)/Glu-tRNA(Gln) amidotransferase subunit GatA n=1 Tax=Candidatus Portiera aleyrodidarum TaxID=91844 RepID=UPI0005D90821|nr:Asp-tRNA(Asn)/Glu-tRNA(Gln) amidotransferase subunit GatA [Candidatus Portiera aleyrodidarum]CEL12472.1 Aspartyl/glutamyl-tRNA(Asn/Gln) amidotransferase subunit A [Candidatus Portiera aleyrodidarum]
MTIIDIINGLKNKQFSCYELIKFILNKIKKNNKDLNCFITIEYKTALKEAKKYDFLRKFNQNNLLNGIPIAYKDIFCTKGIKTTCGSNFLKNFIPTYNSTLIEKLKYYGFINLGKTNMDEFAMGSLNESSYFGQVKNPWNLNLVSGGSSGGSASAISAGLIPASLGTDTGGSIRLPSSYCGITGLKPTYGYLSRYGIISYSSSLDQAGPMAHTVEDCAILLNLLSGYDKLDSTNIKLNKYNFLNYINNSIKGIKIGLPIEYLKNINSKFSCLIQDAINIYKKLGINFVDISLPYIESAISAYYIIVSAEAASNLAKYDGIKYGYYKINPKSLNDLYINPRTIGFGKQVKNRIMIGTYILNNIKYFIKAKKIRNYISNNFIKIFKKVNAIIIPTTKYRANKINKKNQKLNLQQDIYTISINLAGLPVINIPIGFINKCPIGLQIITPPFTENLLLNIAHCYQKNTNWHLNYPNIL